MSYGSLEKQNGKFGIEMTFHNLTPEFWNNKKVFVTGLNGFKGTWLSLMLSLLKANTYGVSLPVSSTPAMFNVVNANTWVNHLVADVRNLSKLGDIVREIMPDVIIHMAAQPIVSEGFTSPVDTFSTNVMGTVNLLEVCRTILKDRKVQVIIVSSDKCYENNETNHPFRVGDPLGGKDPYSASKAGTEIVYKAFNESFFSEANLGVRIASARAGNVIGGGDWSEHRLIPDAAKAFSSNKILQIRRPNATRPWQHVIEPLIGYLKLAEKLNDSKFYSRSWNFGPDQRANADVKTIINLFREAWKSKTRIAIPKSNLGFQEAQSLSLDINETLLHLNLRNKISLERSIEMTASWYKAYYSTEKNNKMKKYTMDQISEFL